MAGTFKTYPFHTRILVAFLLLAAAPSAPGRSLWGSQKTEPDPVLVYVSIKCEIRGVRNAFEINGRLVPDYSPTIVQQFPCTGIAIDHDHVMTFLGYDRWIDIKSCNPQIEVTTNEGQKWNGNLIGVDQRNGVAVVRLSSGKLRKTPVCPQYDVKGGVTIMAPVMEGFKLSQYRKAQILSIGSWPGIPIQSGWMMAMNRAFPDINLPILTTDHCVVGWIASQDPMGRRALVYPISELLSSAKEILKTKDDIRAGWLGVFGEDSPAPADSGILVRDVEPDSPAQKAGLLPGDRLVRYRGRQIQDYRQYVYLVEGTPIGSRARLDIVRGGNPVTLEASIEARKPEVSQIRFSLNFPGALGPPPPGSIPARAPSRTLVGLDTMLLTPDIADALHMPGQTGLFVTNVVRQMPADLAGVRPGDVIKSIDGRPIDDAFAFTSYLMARDWSVPLALKVLRKGAELAISVRIPDEDR